MAMSVTYATVHGRLVEENRGGVVTEYVPDTLGNVIMTTDESGTVTSTTTYWPFGEVRTQTGTNPSPWGFCGVWGYLTDAVSRMYVRARHYRADTSRWLSVDPLWPAQLPYTYADHNAVQYPDPTGLDIGLDKRFSPEERRHANQVISDMLKALDKASADFDDCMKGCTQSTRVKEGTLLLPKTYPDTIDIGERAAIGGFGDKVCVILQYNYNCKEGQCGYAVPGGWLDPCWYVHICMRRGKLSALPSCGPTHCILLHELLHTFGLTHASDVPALDCVNRVPGCERYTGGKSGPMHTLL
jgi:RHS repeat-associated protein